MKVQFEVCKVYLNDYCILSSHNPRPNKSRENFQGVYYFNSTIATQSESGKQFSLSSLTSFNSVKTGDAKSFEG